MTRIWLGSIGRKSSTTDARPAETMLPMLDDVAMRTYFTVLAKILRPSTMPSAITPRLLSTSTTSAASLATSVAVSTEMPTSAACSATASFTPSPRNPTSVPARRCAWMMRAFWSGVTRAKIRDAVTACANAASSKPSSSAPVTVLPAAMPRLRHSASATRGWSPVTTFTVTPSSSNRRMASPASVLARSAKTRKPSSSRSRSSPSPSAVAPGISRRPTATTRAPSCSNPSSVACAPGGSV